MRKKKKRKLLSGSAMMALFFVFIMVLSGVGYMMDRQSGVGTVKYNGHRIVPRGTHYMTKVGSAELSFLFLPSHLEDVNISYEAKQKLNGATTMFITYDPEDRFVRAIAEAEYDISTLSFNAFKIDSILSYTKESEYKRPVVTCDMDNDFPALYFRTGNTTGIYADGNCVVLEGVSENSFYVLRDRLLYQLAGIME